MWTARALTKPYTTNTQHIGKRWTEFLYNSTINKELQILQANIKKYRETQHALHNNKILADFHFILGQEPYYFLLDGEVVLTGLNP